MLESSCAYDQSCFSLFLSFAFLCLSRLSRIWILRQLYPYKIFIDSYQVVCVPFFEALSQGQLEPCFEHCEYFLQHQSFCFFLLLLLPFHFTFVTTQISSFNFRFLATFSWFVSSTIVPFSVKYVSSTFLPACADEWTNKMHYNASSKFFYWVYQSDAQLKFRFFHAVYLLERTLWIDQTHLL